MAHYERRLPHWHVIGQPLFVTFCLHDSLPGPRTFPPENLTSGKAFVTMDRLLHARRSGPLFLAQAEIARLVVDALAFGHQRRNYDLRSFVIMPNHVHLLATPLIETSEWLRSLKSFTGRRANRLLKRQGPFWQNESYDHLVRDRDEFTRIALYIERNPVAAGLVSRPEDFAWSSASRAGARLQA